MGVKMWHEKYVFYTINTTKDTTIYTYNMDVHNCHEKYVFCALRQRYNDEHI